MNLIEQRNFFEGTKHIYESAKLKFHGVDRYDVYNSSIPFNLFGKKSPTSKLPCSQSESVGGG